MMKCTMLIEVQSNVSDAPDKPSREAGFSESLYYDTASFDAVRALWEVVCARRARLLPIGAAVTGQRYQLVDPVGVSQSHAVRFPGASGLASDVPSIALMCAVPTIAARNIGRLMIRGIPDARVTEGEYQASSAFNVALNGYFNSLAGFKIKARNLDATQAPITSIAANGNYVTSANFTAAAGPFMVRVLRSKDEFGQTWGGLFPCTPTSITAGNLANWPGVDVTGGKIRLDLTVYPTVNHADIRIARIITRKVGRPFDLYSGRR